ncbi:MAG: hypothetical protein LBT68_01820, partial [Spirochaetales bacterium]|nr:hypothetical protein [Spirochaetales bacterium]
MENPLYTEHDYVLKSADIEDVLSGCGLVGLNFPREKEDELRRGLEEARDRGGALPLPALNLSAGWDDSRGEYYVVIKNMYDPQNLLDILYERLVWEKTENPEEEAAALRENIEKYLGVIETKEKISLSDEQEKLTELALDMRRTIALYEDGEYSEEDIERLSDSLDRAYF